MRRRFSVGNGKRLKSGPSRLTHRHTALAVALGLLLATATPLARDVVVRRVEDGDTVVAMDRGRRVTVRLFGIDAPESGQPGSREAKAALRRLVEGRRVRIEDHGRDRYGRTLAEMFVNDIDVGLTLVRRGHAWRYLDAAHSSRLAEAEASARKARIGLWAAPRPIPPWDWRKGAGADAGCGAVRSCRQAGSCAAARWALEVCGLDQLDQDGDGMPCESLCRR